MKQQRFLKQIQSKTLFTMLSLFGRMKAVNYDVNNTIVIAGTGRSGTTWLMEILNTIPRTCMIWEPLDLRSIPELYNLIQSMRLSSLISKRTYGLEISRLKSTRISELSWLKNSGIWSINMESGDDWTELEDYLEMVLTGQVLNLHTTLMTRLIDIIKSNRLIVKFCRANRLLKWMTERFSISSVLLIRHPCAVVASQMRHGAWDDRRYPMIDQMILEKHPGLFEIVNSVQTREEALAVDWCIDYAVPLAAEKPHPWILVTYEKLVREGEKELQRLFNAIEVDMSSEAVKHLSIPSETSISSSAISRGVDPLAGWTTYLTNEQVNRVLNIVSQFGLHFYDRKLEPDYDALYNFDPNSVRVIDSQ